MIEAPLYSATGEKRRTAFALPAAYFDGTVNQAVLHQAVLAYRNNQRQGTAQTKTRAMVTGGSEKPWRQKGTGRARQGTIRAPHWRGGGVVFGPSPRDYTTSVPRKVRRLARRSALNARAAEGALVVVEGWAFEKPRTADFLALIGKWGLAGQKVLALTKGPNRPVYLSGRNIGCVEVLPFDEATAYEILWSDAVVVERDALPEGGQEVEASAATRTPKPKAKAVKTVKKAAKKTVKKKATKTTAAKTKAAKTTKAKKTKTSAAKKKKTARKATRGTKKKGSS